MSKLDVKQIASEYSRAGGFNNTYTSWFRADSIRFCRWDGQTDDGRKHQYEYSKKKVFPWDGASDVRVRLADAICSENSDIMTTAFQRGILRASPTESGDGSQSTLVTTLLKYYKENKLMNELRHEAHLLANYGQQYGTGVLQIGWEKEETKANKPVTMEDVVAFSQEADPQSAEAQLPQMIMDPEQEDAAVEIVAALMEVRRNTARRGIKELRNNGVTEIPVAEITKNTPNITALRLDDDFFVPPETIDLQDARYCFRRVWMTEMQLRQGEFDEKWVERVIATKSQPGMVYEDTYTQFTNDTGQQEGLYEIVYAYYRELDDDGMPGIHCCVFTPHITDASGKKDMLDYMSGVYPFVAYRRESVARKFRDSRGVPEICMTWQDEIKTQRDMLSDRASLIINPPIVHAARSGSNYEFKPGTAIAEMRQGEVRYLDPPRSNPAESLQIIQYVERQANEFFGRMGEGIDPNTSAMRRQSMVDTYMSCWSEAFTMMFKLIQEFVSDEELARIAGKEMQLPKSSAEIQGNYDFRTVFDVRELDQDYMSAKLQAMSQFVLPEDTAGVIDRAAYTKFKATLIDPVLADMVVQDKTGATQQAFDKVNSDIGFMALGNEPQYTENDPAAEMKLQFMQQILGNNPKYQELMQEGGDERFTALVENYAKNLQHSVQQRQNAEVGRVGVQPVGSGQESGY
tara:strand:+ start:2105 stop:4168 length:2064 start_codon:yes stop_codon:yes gene_type:complete